MMNNQAEIGQANTKCIPDIYTPVLDIDETGALDTEADGPYVKANLPRGYALRPRHDRTHAVVTLAFVGIFLITIILAFVVIMGFSNDWTATKDLLQLILPAEFALAGSTMGFYFGSRTNRSDRR
jgi:hypothetical protein